jgi:hypothetical protein
LEITRPGQNAGPHEDETADHKEVDMSDDLKNQYPRVRVRFIVTQEGKTSFQPFEFVPGDRKPWDVIRAKQQELFTNGATAACTCDYRVLLDIDGYRE